METRIIIILQKISTFISFKIRNETNITLKIFDIYGKEVTTLIDNKYYSQGKYVQKFNNKWKV